VPLIAAICPRNSSWVFICYYRMQKYK
jgi:hypothetical protein